MNVSDSIQVPSGVLLIDKARDMTSHDVVAIARRSLGIKKIGHCGTLDPMATGLLMLVVGKATKLQDKLMCEHKEYAGTLMLGVETSSQDAMGEIVAEYSVDGVTEQAVREAFDRFDGAFEQIPPMVSAIKKDGVPLLCSMGAANKLDPTAFRVADIEKTTVDPLAKVIRLECRKRRLGKVKVVFSEEQTLPPLQEEIEEAPTAARRTVPASNAFVPAACGLVCGSEVVKDLLRKAGVYRGKK